jgi:uncharacterized protein YndB with AHSA1/START domain
MEQKPSLTLVRRLDAPPRRVFEAWTQPERLANWFGPIGSKVTQADIDARIGGRFDIRFTTPGEEIHQVGGHYREVSPVERLVFTWAWHTTPERESLVTVRLQADGNATILTLLHENFADEPARDRHREGWSGGLDRLVEIFQTATNEVAS